MSMTLSEELAWRGFVNHSTMGDLAVLDSKTHTFYHGYDASSDSQTIGNLAAMMFDKVFIRHGYRAIVLLGGATTLIGDPGGKDTERTLQDEATIAANVKAAEDQIRRIFADQDITLLNNLEWIKDLKVIPFLRDIGKHFSMTPLVQRDYIAQRIGPGGAGISYTEFSYTILQGYDYLHLFDAHGVTLQLGGSDQWGNCLSGVDLVRKARAQEVHAITMPLIINQATGKKFGKSEGGAVWLDATKTSVYAFYQFWLNVEDEAVENYLKIFTELDKEEVENVLEKFNADRSSRLAQKTLAQETTRLVHGKERAESVARVTDVLFGGLDFHELQEQDIAELTKEIPRVQAKDAFHESIVEAGLASSNSEAMRLIGSGAISVNGKKYNPGDDWPFRKGPNLVKRGKNGFALIVED